MRHRVAEGLPCAHPALPPHKLLIGYTINNIISCELVLVLVLGLPRAHPAQPPYIHYYCTVIGIILQLSELALAFALVLGLPHSHPALPPRIILLLFYGYWYYFTIISISISIDRMIISMKIAR